MAAACQRAAMEKWSSLLDGFALEVPGCAVLIKHIDRNSSTLQYREVFLVCEHF